MTTWPLRRRDISVVGAVRSICRQSFQVAAMAVVLCAMSSVAQPAITTQPFNRTNNIGDLAQFTVAATGTAPLTYQWRRNGANISGATTNVLSVLVTNVDNGGTYSVVVTDSTAVSTTSGNATLSVFFADRTRFTQWNYNSTTPDNDVNTGNTSPSIGAGSNSVAGATANGFNTGATSDPNTTDNTSRRWNAFKSTEVNKTAGAKYAVSTSGYDNIAFTGELWLATRSSAYWRGQYTTNGTDWVDRALISRRAANLAGFFYFADDLSGVEGVANNPTFAYRVVAEYENTATGSGAAAYVSVDPASTFNATSSLFGWDLITFYGTPISQQPVITLQPQTHTNYVNTGGGFSVQATGGNLGYQWYFNNSPIASGTGADLIIPNVQYSDAGTYRVVVSNSAGTATSDDAFLTVADVVLPQGDRFWSANGATAGGGGGGGNWDTNTPNRWGTDIAGPFNLQWNNSRLDNAVFPPGSGVVTNPSGVAVNMITVTNSPGAAYIFGGAGKISFLGPDSSIYIAGANNANASNLLSSTCQLVGTVVTKNGGGRLHLDNTNNNVGRWVVNQGALTGSGVANVFGSQPPQSISNYITLDGGGLGFISSVAMSLGTNRGIYLGPNGGQIGNQGTGGIITVDAPITGPGSLHFPGNTEWPGQLQGDNCTYIISNTNNNYQGITRIAVPEVRLGANQVFPLGTTLLISNLSIGGRLNLNGFNQTVAKVILDSTSGNSRIFDTVGTGSLSATEFDLRRSAQSANVSAVLAGPGTLTKTTTGNITLSAPNTYSGDTFLQAGTLTLNAAGRFGNGAGTLHLQGATLTIPESRTDTTAVINPTSLEVGTLVQGTPNATNHLLFIHGGTWSMAGGALYVFNPNTNGFLFQVALTNALNFTLPIDMATGCHFISYNPAGSDQVFSGGISGAGVFRRAVSSGTGGRTIFTSDNSYTGGTIVTAGTLLANNPSGGASATGSGAVAVSGAGTLGGTGTIGGAVTVTSGGTLAADVGGVLTLQSGLDLNGGGTNTWELAALKDSSTGAAGVDFGQIVLTGGELNLGGSSVLALKFSGATAPNSSVTFWQSTHQWKIINVNGGLNTANATFASIANATYGAGFFSTSVDGSGNIILTFTAQVQGPPTVTGNPQSRSNVIGTTASFTVTATGAAPLTYAWYRSPNGFTPINNATNATFTIPNVQGADAGTYFARVYDTFGNNATSQSATLSVVSSPNVQLSRGTGGANVVLNWTTLTGTQYQVQYNTNVASVNWLPLTTVSGTGGSVSVTNNAPVGDPQRYFRLLIQ